MMDGWTCSHRKIWEHPLFEGNALRVGVWQYLIHMAAWKDIRFRTGGKTITVKRGQVCVSQRQIENATGMGRQALRTFLSELEKEGAISTSAAHDATHSRNIITICKYDAYQHENEIDNPTATQQQPTKEHLNKTSVSKDTGGKTADPLKVMFDAGRALLADAGVPAKQAGSLLGRWRKALGTEGVIVALGKCQREGAIDPVSFMEGIVKNHKANPKTKTAPLGKVNIGGQFIPDRTNSPKLKGATHEDRFGNPERGGDKPSQSFGRQSSGDVSGVQPTPEEEARYVPFGDDPIGRGGSGVLSSLRMEVC